jgi:hypothetical protein
METGSNFSSLVRSAMNQNGMTGKDTEDNHILHVLDRLNDKYVYRYRENTGEVNFQEQLAPIDIYA